MSLEALRVDKDRDAISLCNKSKLQQMFTKMFAACASSKPPHAVQRPAVCL